MKAKKKHFLQKKYDFFFVISIPKKVLKNFANCRKNKFSRLKGELIAILSAGSLSLYLLEIRLKHIANRQLEKKTMNAPKQKTNLFFDKKFNIQCQNKTKLASYSAISTEFSDHSLARKTQ